MLFKFKLSSPPTVFTGTLVDWRLILYAPMRLRIRVNDQTLLDEEIDQQPYVRQVAEGSTYLLSLFSLVFLFFSCQCLFSELRPKP